MPDAASRPARRAQSLPLGISPRDANAFALWLHRQDKTVEDFRAMLGDAGVKVSGQAVRSWRRGTGAPKRTTAVIIERLTRGAVAVASW